MKKILNILTAYNQCHLDLNEDNQVIIKKNEEIITKDIDSYIKEYLNSLINFHQKPYVCYVGIWSGEKIDDKTIWTVDEDLTIKYKK